MKAESLGNLGHEDASHLIPVLGQRAPEVQAFGTHFRLSNALSELASAVSIEALNRVLVNTMVLRDLYKKHHWQVSGHTFYQLHLLFDKHYDEQVKIIDSVAERIQMLGGVSIALAQDVADLTTIERAPRGREEVPVQLSRLLEAHEIILRQAHEGAKMAADNGDDGTNDLLVSEVIRKNELHVWFLSEHLVDTPATLV